MALDGVAAQEGKLALPFRYLRVQTTAGFTEWEFFPDGKLLEYDYTDDNSESGDDIPVALFQPRFSVRSLKWKRDERGVLVQRGDKTNLARFEGDATEVMVHVMSWSKVERLRFFDELDKYCGRDGKKKGKGGE
jgi:hypothetical protein